MGTVTEASIRIWGKEQDGPVPRTDLKEKDQPVSSPRQQ